MNKIYKINQSTKYKNLIGHILPKPQRTHSAHRAVSYRVKKKVGSKPQQEEEVPMDRKRADVCDKGEGRTKVTSRT